MKTALHILKVGGHLVNDADALEEVLTAFAGLEGVKLLVHGGGRHATALAKDANLLQLAPYWDLPTLYLM